MQLSLRNTIFFYLFATAFVLFVSLALFTDEYFFSVIPFAGLLFYAGWQNRNFFFLLLLLSLSFSFEYNFSPSLGTDLPDEPLMLFVTGLFLAYWIYFPGAVPGTKWRHPLLFVLAMVLLWTVVASLFSSYPLLSIKFLLAKIWYMGAFILAPLIVFDNKKYLINAAIILAASLTIVALIALTRHYQYGFRFANINDAVSPFFRNHVNYSAMLVCCVPLLLAFYKYSSWKIVIATAIMVILVALFFSYSRGAWLALITGAGAWWLTRKRLLLITYIAVIIAVAGAIFWLRKDDNYLKYANDFKTTIFHKDFSEHLIATYKLKDVSTAERFYRWVAGIRMAGSRPVTGFGPNTFYNNYKSYTIPAFKTWVSDNDDHSTVHNYFLLTALEQGIPGLVLLLLLFGAMLYYAQHLYHRLPEGVYKSAAITIAVIVTMIMTVNFLSDLVETDKIGSLFFLCIAALVTIDAGSRKEQVIKSSL